MGAKQSRLSEEDFLFLEEETGMSKTTLQVEKFRPEYKKVQTRVLDDMKCPIFILF